MISDSPDHGLIPHSGEGASDQGIDLLALVAAFCEEWRLALTTFLVVMVICIAIIFSLRKQYVAVCSIVPQAGQSNNDLSSLFSNRSPSTLYVGLLQSRTVADDIIDQAHLLDYFHTRSREIARDELADKTTVTSGSDSIVIIKVKDPSASQAALISNAYLTGLEHLNGVMSEDSSRQTREFFQAQLQQERDDLNKAETQLEQTQQKTGIIQPETQTQIGLSAIASTRAQITNLEVQLAAVLQSETEDNPRLTCCAPRSPSCVLARGPWRTAGRALRSGRPRLRDRCRKTILTSSALSATSNTTTRLSALSRINMRPRASRKMSVAPTSR